MQPWLRTRIDRYAEFYRNPERGQILGMFSRWTFPISDSDLGLPEYPNDHWDWEHDPTPQVDHAIRSLRAYLTDADVTFTAETSWAQESQADWSQIDAVVPGRDVMKLIRNASRLG